MFKCNIFHFQYFFFYGCVFLISILYLLISSHIFCHVRILQLLFLDKTFELVGFGKNIKAEWEVFVLKVNGFILLAILRFYTPLIIEDVVICVLLQVLDRLVDESVLGFVIIYFFGIICCTIVIDYTDQVQF